METKIEKCSLSIITRLPQICKPNEFMVAFFIINTMSIEKKDRIKMYRGELADLCNMSERNISRLTDSLNNIGIIQKELIGDAEKKKTFNYYRLNWQKIDEIFAEIVNENDSFLPKLSGLKNERTKELKKKRIKEDKNERIESKNINEPLDKSIDDVGKTLGGDFTKSSPSGIEKLIDDELKNVTTFEENRTVATELRKVIPYKYKELIDRKVGEKVEFIRALQKT